MSALKIERADLDRYVTALCSEVKNEYRINPNHYIGDAVKRGLRNADGTGVMAGVTRVGSVQPSWSASTPF